ncbi:unnamed protein product [Camellia sinensis]
MQNRRGKEGSKHRIPFKTFTPWLLIAEHRILFKEENQEEREKREASNGKGFKWCSLSLSSPHSHTLSHMPYHTTNF